MTAFTLADLDRIVRERAAAAPEESYTAKLVAGGPARPAKKLGEEAVEAAIAAVQGDRAGLTAEAADVLYHLLWSSGRRGAAGRGDGGTGAAPGPERHRREGGEEAGMNEASMTMPA